MARLRMTGSWRRRAAEEDGMALVVSLIVTLVVFSLGAVWISIGTHAVVSSGREAMRDRARNAAEAGLNYAMGQLAADPAWGSAETAPIAVGGGEFTVSVSAVVADPLDPRRTITAKGFAPTMGHPQRVARKLLHQVNLVPIDGFQYALFAAPGGVTGGNHLTVQGDLYSRDDLVLSNNSTINGDVTSLGSVTTNNNSTIAGDVHAAGDVTLDNSSTTVIGDVRSGGNVVITGRVKGSVQAAGTITGGIVDGSRNQYSNPPPPRAQTLPTFTWDPTLYSPAPITHATPEAFESYWQANTAGFSGHHRVLCPAPCNPIDLDKKWSMTADVTIMADGPVKLTREIDNKSSPKTPLTLSVISLASTYPVEMTNNIVLDDVNLLIYAPNGTVRFANLKSFSGAVYAGAVQTDQYFTLKYVPVSAPGFDWSVAAAAHFQIEAGAFREVPF